MTTGDPVQDDLQMMLDILDADAAHAREVMTYTSKSQFKSDRDRTQYVEVWGIDKYDGLPE